jgi:fibronectin type III domain protein
VSVKIKGWTKPLSPTGLTATPVSSSQIDLSWTDNSTNESHFGVFKWNGIGWAQVAILPADTTSYSRLGLHPDHEYRFQVRAFNGLGYSKKGEVVMATTLP